MLKANDIFTRRPTITLACSAIRDGRYDEAMTLLSESQACRPHDGYALNLLGVVHECKGDWNMARRIYGKAMIADKALNAPRQNLRRIYELHTFGRTREPLSLGDHEILLRKSLESSLTRSTLVSTPS